MDAVVDIHLRGIRFRAGTVKIAADEDRATAGVARHINAGVARQPHLCAQHLDRAADAAHSDSGCVQRPAHLHDTRRTAIDDDDAIAVDQ